MKRSCTRCLYCSKLTDNSHSQASLSDFNTKTPENTFEAGESGKKNRQEFSIKYTEDHVTGEYCESLDGIAHLYMTLACSKLLSKMPIKTPQRLALKRSSISIARQVPSSLLWFGLDKLLLLSS